MRTNRQRSAWIIGAGYLGKELAKQCRAEGWSVLTIDKRAADLEGDAADPETLRRAMELLPDPDGIFCCTAISIITTTLGYSYGDAWWECSGLSLCVWRCGEQRHSILSWGTNRILLIHGGVRGKGRRECD